MKRKNSQVRSSSDEKHFSKLKKKINNTKKINFEIIAFSFLSEALHQVKIKFSCQRQDINHQSHSSISIYFFYLL
jgi:hypothetical protein